jgi:hypothetical protein
MTTKDAGHAGYVEEALLLGGYALDAAAVARVKIEFARIAAIAAALGDEGLSEHAEPLPVYRP